MKRIQLATRNWDHVIPLALGDVPQERYAFERREITPDLWSEPGLDGVRKGNPAGISDLDSTCGKKIAVMASGSAEKVIKGHSEKCIAAGNPAIDVQSYKDQPTAILSVQSSRADAFFSSQAPLTYFVEQANGALELTGTGQKNGFSDLFQGAVVPVDSPMADVLLKAFNILYENGTYEKIMKDHKLDGNMIDEPGLNLGVS